MSRLQGLVFGLVALIIIVMAAVFINPSSREKVFNFFNPDKVEKVQEDIVVTPPTIQDVLQFRKDILDTQYYDSVFLHMPEIPLIAILLKKGTELSNYEISREYLSNKKYYDDVEFGSQISTIYKQQIEPDTIPKISLPDSMIPE